MSVLGTKTFRKQAA